MPPLPTNLRRDLERAIIKARDVAEAGARAALEALTIHEGKVGGHLTGDQRTLRNRLRAHARQLGDKRNSRSGAQAIDRLVRECAYEHWHRMIFARFLAENDLLVEPESGVSVTLDEVEELARDAKADPWDLASRYAQRMLPQIFRPDDPLLAVALPTETRVELESLLESLPAETFRADDSLGWVYQFWQSKRKDEVNAWGEKITGDTLPAVTQLFTEHYMVLFLLHNTVGAWHAGKVLAQRPGLAETAGSEQELRDAVALFQADGYSFEYLRFVKVEEASSLLPEHEKTCDEAKSQDGSSTIDINYFDKTEPIAELAGNLPHWRQEGVTYFITFRTADSLPADKWKQWQSERDQWLKDHPKPHDEQTKREYYDKFPARIQKWLDQGYGKCVLAKPETQQIVENAIRHFDGKRYVLDEFVVAANHVHVLVTPLGEHQLSDILHSWKSFTANRINKTIGETGAFWQKESFDHIVRSPEQFEKIRKYISDHDNVDAASSRVREGKSQDGSLVEEASSLLHKPYRPTKSQDGSLVEEASSLLHKPYRPNKSQDGSSTEASSLLHKPYRPNKSQDGSSTEASSLLHKPYRPTKSQDGSSTLWRPAAGTFDGWPQTASELKVLDPCCGSGHFLVAVFELLTRLRMDEEGLSVEKASRTVLRDNVFGLEIDQRCTQIAAFALAFAAWKLVGRVIDLPPLHVACCGIGPSATLEEWLQLAEHAEHTLPAHAREPVRNGLENLHRLFSQASELGSLIDPTQLPSDMFAADYETLQPFLEEVFQRESADVEGRERAVAAQGMAKTADILGGDYTLVITNVPYLEQRKQSPELRAFCQANYAHAKGDLASVFVDRSFGFLVRGGTGALVTPQNWLYLTTYGKLRNRLLKMKQWHAVAKLGPGAFGTITGHVVQPVLIVLDEAQPPVSCSPFSLDASGFSTPDAKSDVICSQEPLFDTQESILANPDARVVFGFKSSTQVLGDYAWCLAGIMNGDSPKFLRVFWEMPSKCELWAYQQTTVESTRFFGGMTNLVFFDEIERHLREDANIRRSKLHNSDERGNQVWGRRGVAITQMSNCPVAFYDGNKYDSNIAVVSPHDEKLLWPIWAYCNSSEFIAAVKELEPKMNVTNATFAKLPFDLAYWQKVAAEKYPNGLPKPYSDDPTQWVFHGYPGGKVEAASSRLGAESTESTRQDAASTLQVAVARLLGYRWPAELDAEMELSDDARALVRRCDELLDLADDDGIVCLPAVRAEATAAERLRRMLRAAHGPEWSVGKEADLLGAADAAGKSLDEWLRNMFFEQHCKLFHHRPFIWHIWDGKKDGFHALVNYHKLCNVDAASSRVRGRSTSQDGSSTSGRKLLETLTYSYLGDWIVRQEDGIKQDEPGAEARLAAAKTLQGELEKILEGEPPYDIFVRWKPLHQQPIGWEPDINDGVRLNIRPFLMAKDVGRKGAGILRFKPNCKWKKDRGKEPQRDKDDYPWFWGDVDAASSRVDYDGESQDGSSTFTGNRWNDLHYTNAFKQAARERAARHEADA